MRPPPEAQKPQFASVPKAHIELPTTHTVCPALLAVIGPLRKAACTGPPPVRHTAAPALAVNAAEHFRFKEFAFFMRTFPLSLGP